VTSSCRARSIHAVNEGHANRQKYEPDAVAERKKILQTLKLELRSIGAHEGLDKSARAWIVIVDEAVTWRAVSPDRATHRSPMSQRRARGGLFSAPSKAGCADVTANDAILHATVRNLVVKRLS
jgi:hypothetical protein